MADVNVSFGAIDQGVAAAARKIAGELAVMDKVGGKVTQSTGMMGKTVGMFGRSLVGPLAGLARFGPHGLAIAAMGGAWMAAAKGAEAYAAIDKQAGQEMEVTRLKAQGLWETLGKMSRDSFGINVLSPLKALEQGLADAVGIDPEVQRLHAENMNREAQRALDLALARDEGERSFLRTLQQETAEFEKQKLLRLAMEKAGLITQKDRGQLDRIAGETFRSTIGGLFAGENSRNAEERRKKEAAAREGSDAFQDHTFGVFQKMEADRKSLEYTIAEANIDRLSAQGKEKEARIEQVRLQTLQKIADIKAMENATDDQKRRAIEAVQRAEAAQLGQLNGPAFAATGRFTGSQVIMPGLVSAGLSRQVFGPGGEGASGGDRGLKELAGARKAGEETVKVLRSIESKIASVGGYGP